MVHKRPSVSLLRVGLLAVITKVYTGCSRKTDLRSRRQTPSIDLDLTPIIRVPKQRGNITLVGTVHLLLKTFMLPLSVVGTQHFQHATGVINVCSSHKNVCLIRCCSQNMIILFYEASRSHFQVSFNAS